MSKIKEENDNNIQLNDDNTESINSSLNVELNSNSILDASILSKPRSSLDKIRAEICESSGDEIECEVEAIEETEDVKERKKDYETLNTKWTGE